MTIDDLAVIVKIERERDEAREALGTALGSQEALAVALTQLHELQEKHDRQTDRLIEMQQRLTEVTQGNQQERSEPRMAETQLSVDPLGDDYKIIRNGTMYAVDADTADLIRRARRMEAGQESTMETAIFEAGMQRERIRELAGHGQKEEADIKAAYAAMDKEALSAPDISCGQMDCAGRVSGEPLSWRERIEDRVAAVRYHWQQMMQPRARASEEWSAFTHHAARMVRPDGEHRRAVIADRQPSDPPMRQPGQAWPARVQEPRTHEKARAVVAAVQTVAARRERGHEQGVA